MPQPEARTVSRFHRVLLFLPLIVLVLAGGFYLVANYQARKIIDTRMQEMVASGTYQSLAYEDFTLGIDGTMNLNGLQVRDAAGINYVIDTIEISDYDYFSEVPHHLTLAAAGMHFPAGIPAFGNTSNSSLNDYLTTVMSADFLPVEFTYSHNYSADDNRQLDSTFSVNLPASFRLSSESVMRNLPLEALGESATVNPMQNMSFMRADIPSASIALQDLGIVEAMLAVQGENNGLSSEDYRQQLLAQVQAMALFAPQQLQALAQKLVANLADFLEGEKTLELTVTPEYEGNVQRLQGDLMGAFYTGNFQRMIELLNLEIETY